MDNSFYSSIIILSPNVMEREIPIILNEFGKYLHLRETLFSGKGADANEKIEELLFQHARGSHFRPAFRLNEPIPPVSLIMHSNGNAYIPSSTNEMGTEMALRHNDRVLETMEERGFERHPQKNPRHLLSVVDRPHGAAEVLKGLVQRSETRSEETQRYYVQLRAPHLSGFEIPNYNPNQPALVIFRAANNHELSNGKAELFEGIKNFSEVVIFHERAQQLARELDSEGLLAPESQVWLPTPSSAQRSGLEGGKLEDRRSDTRGKIDGPFFVP